MPKSCSSFYSGRECLFLYQKINVSHRSVLCSEVPLSVRLPVPQAYGSATVVNEGRIVKHTVDGDLNPFRGNSVTRKTKNTCIFHIPWAQNTRVSPSEQEDLLSPSAPLQSATGVYGGAGQEAPVGFTATQALLHRLKPRRTYLSM